MPGKKKPLGTYTPGTSGRAITDNEIIILGDFDEQGNFVSFIGPGGRRFTAGTAGVNQLTAGVGIALNPPGGTGTVQVINTRQGTVSSVGLQMPNAFTVADSPITMSGDLIVNWGAGQVPPQNLTTGPYRSDFFINSMGQSTAVVGTATQFLRFLGSAMGGPNQRFSDPGLLVYASDELRVTVLINGVAITPGTSFSLDQDTITVIDYLAPNAEVEVISKTLTASGAVIGTVTNVSVSTALSQAFRFLTPMSTPVLDLALNINNPTTSYLRGDGQFVQDPLFLSRSFDVFSQYRSTPSTATVVSFTGTSLTVTNGALFTVGQYISARDMPFIAVPITAIAGNVLTVDATQWGTPPTPTVTTIFTWSVPNDRSALIYLRNGQKYTNEGYLNFESNQILLSSITNPTGVQDLDHTNGVFINPTAFPTNYTITNSVVVGAGAGQNNMRTSVAIGTNALANGTAMAGNNIAIGNNSQQMLQSTDNIGIGVNTMVGTATSNGSLNIAIGRQAMQNINAGLQGIALGFNALQVWSSGSNNIAIGHTALARATTSSANVAIGGTSGALLTTGSNNLFLGTNSGNLCTISSGNTIIGGFTGQQVSTPARPTDLDITTANSNYLVISDNRAVGSANILAVCDNNQNWGFGKSTNLQAKVHIEGALRVQQAWEKGVVNTTALTGVTVIPVGQAGEFLFTTAATANFTFNFTGNNPDAVPATTATLNSILPIGHSVTVSIITTQGATAFFCSVVQIDGVVIASPSIRWQGSAAPAFGSPNGFDVYTFVIYKSASATYRVLGSRTQYGG